jgi:hypothetical protein
VLENENTAVAPPERTRQLLGELRSWVESARKAGLDDEGIRGLVSASMDEAEWANERRRKGSGR